MKKLLARLLTLILIFSCFGVLSMCTELATGQKSEPDTTNAVFYEGFEKITQTELESFITNRTWSKPALVTGDAATGNKSVALKAYYEYLFIPVDKSKLEVGTIYEFSMDWKMKVPTLSKKSSISNLAFIGYNPSEGEDIKNDAQSFVEKSNLYGTGNWENEILSFKITDLDYDYYEQFGILIRYASSEPYDNTDTLYVDTLMIAPAKDQSGVTKFELMENERTDDTVKALVFGNSFSTDSAVLIDDFARADGKDLRIGNAVIGGCSLEKHYKYMLNGSERYGFSYYSNATKKSQTFLNVSMQQALAATDWDYIVIQQVSQDSGMSDTFEPYLSELLAYFKEKCPNAKILLHATWAYAQDSTHEGFANYGNVQTTMHEAIEDAYLAASARHGYIPIIPTGEAIRRARATSMGDNFNRDGYHLNDNGRLLAALVWYETFTGVSALEANIDLTKITGTIGNTGGVVGFVTEEESTLIKTAAHEAVELFKLANETQLAIEAIGTANANSAEKIEAAKALRAELNDDTLLPNLQTLLDAIEN